MADLITMLSAVAGQQGEEVDDDFNQTVLLLHGDGTNGAQNNTFLDGSTNNFTITRNGNTTQGTFSPFSVGAGEWSNYFDGNGDGLSVTDSALNFSSGDFTVEGFFYPTSFGANQIIVENGTGVSGDFDIYIDPTGLLSIGKSGTIAASKQLTLNVWNYFVGVKSGSDYYVYVDGVKSSVGTMAAPNSKTILYIGIRNASTIPLFGYLSNLRVSNTVRYSASTISIPTTPFSSDGNTLLLTCQSNRFVDNSGTPKAITRYNDVRVTPFSPFAPSAAYSPSVNGGSGYFDGTGDYLTVPDNAAFDLSGDFTIEFVAYATGANNRRFFQLGDYRSANNGLVIYTNASNALVVYVNGATIITGSAFPLNQWVYVALVRSGGGSNNLKLYMNAVQDGQATNTVSFTGVAGNGVAIGAEYGGSYSATAECYISTVRIVNGTALTPAVPTAPLTAITNTSLLLNFTNAGIFDNTGKNNLETVGNAQIDTTTKKFGTGSMEFDGTGDWLQVPNNPDQQLGTGNFTIEFWVYLATGDIGSARGLVAKGTSTTGLLVSLDSSQKVVFTFTTSTITSSGAITLDAWNHIAVVREGTGSNQTKIYISGTNDGTGTVSTDFNQTSVMYVGANRTGGDPMKGFIDDLRITKGVARYTANFSVPNRAFPDL